MYTQIFEIHLHIKSYNCHPTFKAPEIRRFKYELNILYVKLSLAPIYGYKLVFILQEAQGP